MRRKIFLALAALCAFCAFAQQKQALVLHTVEGGEIVYFLDDEPTVTFADQDMLVATSADEAPASIPMENVESWTLEYKDASAIRDLKAQGMSRVSILGGSIIVSNPQGGQVAVFTIDGRMAASASGTEVKFNLPRGLYIIKTANKTFKISNF